MPKGQEKGTSICGALLHARLAHAIRRFPIGQRRHHDSCLPGEETEAQRAHAETDTGLGHLPVPRLAEAWGSSSGLPDPKLGLVLGTLLPLGKPVG